MNEELNVIKKNYDFISKAKEVKENPVTETIVELLKVVPGIGDLIDSSINHAIDSFQEKKQKELIDVILKKSSMITSEQVNDVEFIFNFARTVDAVKRLATNDKVKFFGNLIRNGYLVDEKIESSRFDEYFEILGEMSFREIEYLVAYKQYCDSKAINGKRVKYNHYVSFSREYAKQMNIDLHSIYNTFMRLKRTGFVDENLETETGQVDEGNVPALTVDGGGFYIDRLFLDFYNMVLNSEI